MKDKKDCLLKDLKGFSLKVQKVSLLNNLKGSLLKYQKGSLLKDLKGSFLKDERGLLLKDQKVLHSKIKTCKNVPQPRNLYNFVNLFFDKEKARFLSP